MSEIKVIAKENKIILEQEKIPDAEKNISSKIAQNKKISEDLNQIELLERKHWREDENTFNYLYPSLNDPNFNIKIAKKKEFNDTKYDGEIRDINKYANVLCNVDFELAPHQLFVKNFLSFETPYNSLLLYHGLGSGKTCSAIGVAEEMRDFNKQLGTTQRIIIVASPNVQENFKLQLFDRSKLRLVDGIWTINSCTGNKFLREINPMNIKGLSEEKIVTQVNRLINLSYLFLGYIEFANYISKKSSLPSDVVKDRDGIIKRRLKNHFDNRLIIIDEVHNIRVTDDNKNKRVAQELFKLVNNVKSLRLLLLSATPLYNSYKEIIWLINIMNINDNRSAIEASDVFDIQGNFKRDLDGYESGKELLRRKATGYISYVRGDNPYTFPYRIWPSQFAPNKTLDNFPRPAFQLNRKPLSEFIKHLSLYIGELQEYQNDVYNYIIEKFKGDGLQESLSKFKNLDSLGYVLLQRPIEALNMVYPNERFESGSDVEIEELLGKKGLSNIVTYKESYSPPFRGNFKYKDTKFGRIFSPSEIGKYSSKIKRITDNIINSDGVVLIYSQYLDAGVVPMALALEEMGFSRHSGIPSLFESPPTKYKLDLNTYTNISSKTANYAKYIMITGDKQLSPNNVNELLAATNINNTNGDKVKVILISLAGAEGLDFKYIRQVHIMEPWYNLSRIEQIIGRAVRNCSHKNLPFEKRNVELFLHGTNLSNEDDEAADIYIYRLAEYKAIQIGHVNRILKEVSVDCLLNKGQLNFTEEKIDQRVVQLLSNREKIEYNVGDKPYSAQCDYMRTCYYACNPNAEIEKINKLTYGEKFIETNIDRIIYRIKQLMKEKFYYTIDSLIRGINIIKPYPESQIYAALDVLINDKSEFITDKYNRLGHLINIDDLYIFQPIELTNNNSSIFERSNPIPYKHGKLHIRLSDKRTEEEAESKQNIEISIVSDAGKDIIRELYENFTLATSKQFAIRGVDNWYIFCSIIFNDPNEIFVNVPIYIREEFIIAHSMELLEFEDQVKIINYLYNKKLNEFEEKLKSYFEGKEIENNGTQGLVLIKLGKLQVLVKEKNIWIPAKSEDLNDLNKFLKNQIPISKYSYVIGFVSNIENKYLIYKAKQLFNPITKKFNTRNKGARCDQAAKKTTRELLNLIVSEDKYTSGYTQKFTQKYLCVLQELILRLFDYNERQDKRWFLTPAEAVINDIENLEIGKN